MTAKTHKDVEFAVDDSASREKVFKSFDAAAGYAVTRALSAGTVFLDVLVFSRAGAKWWSGDDGVDQYEEDHEASVFERFEIQVNPQGRVP